VGATPAAIAVGRSGGPAAGDGAGRPAERPGSAGRAEPAWRAFSVTGGVAVCAVTLAAILIPILQRDSRQLGDPIHQPGFVDQVVFSSDGHTITSQVNGQLLLWDVRTHKQVGSGPFGFSNGGTLSSYGFWGARTQQQVTTPVPFTSQFLDCVTLSPDHRLLATVGGSNGPHGAVQLWSVRSRLPVGPRLQGAPNAPCAAFSPDGRMLAYAGVGNTIRLFDIPARNQIGPPLKGPYKDDQVFSIAFSPSGRLVAAGATGEVWLWDARSHKPVGAPLGDQIQAGSASIAFSPDGAILAIASGNTITLWNVHNHEQIASPLHGHTDSIYSVAFSPDGHLLASGGLDKTVRLWRVPSLPK
jgi:WD40 repeat protein